MNPDPLFAHQSVSGPQSPRIPNEGWDYIISKVPSSSPPKGLAYGMVLSSIILCPRYTTELSLERFPLVCTLNRESLLVEDNLQSG